MEPVTKHQRVKSVEGHWSSQGQRMSGVVVRLDNSDHFVVDPANVPPLGAAITVTYAVATDEPLPFASKLDELKAGAEYVRQATERVS